MIVSEKCPRPFGTTCRNVGLGVLFTLATVHPGAAMAEWYIAPDLTYTDPDSKVYDDWDLGFGISLGHSLWGSTDLELGYSVTKLALQTAPGVVRRRQLLLNSVTSLDWQRDWTPYLSFGLGAARLEHSGDVDTVPVATAGLGYSFPVPYLHGLDVQPEVRAAYTRNTDNAPKRNEVDGQAVVRVRYEPFAKPTPAQVAPSPPQPVETAIVVPKPASLSEFCASQVPGSASYRQNRCDRLLDRDGDTIPDQQDYCPNTIPGVKVDSDGCLLAL